MAFAGLPECLTDAEALKTFRQGLATPAKGKIDKAVQRIKEDGYHLQLYYVTLGTCAEALAEEARKVARRCGSNTGNVELEVLDGKRVMRLLAAREGLTAAPPSPTFALDGRYGVNLYRANVTERLRQLEEQGVVQRIQQRAARPAENGIRPGGAATVHPDVPA